MICRVLRWRRVVLRGESLEEVGVVEVVVEEATGGMNFQHFPMGLDHEQHYFSTEDLESQGLEI